MGQIPRSTERISSFSKNLLGGYMHSYERFLVAYRFYEFCVQCAFDTLFDKGSSLTCLALFVETGF